MLLRFQIRNSLSIREIQSLVYFYGDSTIGTVLVSRNKTHHNYLNSLVVDIQAARVSFHCTTNDQLDMPFRIQMLLIWGT